jgi:hypothetical protein
MSRGSSKKRVRPGCGDDRPGVRPGNLASVVSAYIRDHRVPAARELQYFARQATIETAVERAALCLTEDDHRHPHQRRIPRDVLQQTKRRLLATTLTTVHSFEELHDPRPNLQRDWWHPWDRRTNDLRHRTANRRKVGSGPERVAGPTLTAVRHDVDKEVLEVPRHLRISDSTYSLLCSTASS